MMMLTKENRAALPALYAQDGKGDEAIAHVKFFNPVGAGTWYATEFDGEDMFFGLADLGMGEPELGYFTLSEFATVKLPFGLTIERDMHWTPRTLAEVKS